jgi:branched-chain amino acid transport system permease protein
MLNPDFLEDIGSVAGHSDQNMDRVSIFRLSTLWVLALIVVMLALPLFFREKIYTIHLLSTIYLNGIIVLGFLLILGYTKQFSLRHVAFYWIGAYTTAILTAKLQINFFIALFASGAVAGFAGILIAIPATRFQGPWLALVTFAFAEIIRILMIRLKTLTGGFGGFFNIPRPALGDFVFDTDFKMYYVFLFVFLLVVFAAYRIRFSAVGRVWLSLGDNEDLSASLGTNIFFQKIGAFTVGSLFAGLAGSLYAGYANFISPESFTLKHTIYYLCILIVGGLESFSGALAGTLFFTLLSSFIMSLYPWDMVLFGFIIVLFVNLMPGGIGEHLVRAAYRLGLDVPGGSSRRP